MPGDDKRRGSIKVESGPTMSLRGALATKQSILPLTRRDGLLRGACHRARIRATRWLAMAVWLCPRKSFGIIRDPLRLDSDLAQLPGRHRDLAAEIKAGRGSRPAGHERHAVLVEDAFDIRHYRAQIGTKTGCQNDRIEFFAGRIGEYDTIRREIIDAAAHLDRPISDLRERADVDQRHAPVLFDHLARTFGRAAQAELFEIAEREPQHRCVDGIDEARGQAPIQDHPRENGKTEEIARNDLDRAAHGERDIDPGIGEIERDLASGIAEAYDQHALACIRFG